MNGARKRGGGNQWGISLEAYNLAMGNLQICFFTYRIRGNGVWNQKGISDQRDW